MHSHHPLEIFREFHRQFGIVAKQNKVNFVFECRGEEDGWPQENSIRIDAVRFGQVLRNLLTNAFKFTPENGSIQMVVSKVERQFAGESEHPFLCLEVIDSGAGISKENQKKLFGQYVQFNAEKLQKGGGSGLGLWICKGEW